MSGGVTALRTHLEAGGFGAPALLRTPLPGQPPDHDGGDDHGHRPTRPLQHRPRHAVPYASPLGYGPSQIVLIVNGRLRRRAEKPTDGAVESGSCALSSVRLPRPLGTAVLVRVPATGGYENPRVALGRGPSEFRSFRRQPPMPPPPRVRRVTEPDSQRRARGDAPAVFVPARHKRLAKMGCAGSRAGRQRAALGSRCAWWRVPPTATAATTTSKAARGRTL